MDNTKRYVKYIEESIDDVCPYDDVNRQRLYHIGFMRGVLAKLMLEDNKNFYVFKSIIEENKDGSKE